MLNLKPKRVINLNHKIFRQHIIVSLTHPHKSMLSLIPVSRQTFLFPDKLMQDE